jgi:hypothetical protein
MPASPLDYTVGTLVMEEERDDGLFLGNLDALSLSYILRRDESDDTARNRQ